MKESLHPGQTRRDLANSFGCAEAAGASDSSSNDVKANASSRQCSMSCHLFIIFDSDIE